MGKLVTFVYQGIHYTGKIVGEDSNIGTAVKIISPESQLNEVLNFPPGVFRRILLGGVEDMTSGVDFTKHFEEPEPEVSLITEESVDNTILYAFKDNGMNYTGNILYRDVDGTVHIEVKSPSHSTGRVLSFDAAGNLSSTG